MSAARRLRQIYSAVPDAGCRGPGVAAVTAGSLFSGIGGFDLGFERAGMTVAWQVEIEPFCRAILERHFPNAKRHADIRECGSRNLSTVDLICAGVPCQDVSVAGKRAGLAGQRTGLFYEFARILRELRPRWFVFENVPGLFSSNGGRDFAEVLRVLMVECGYGVCWRLLDSQFFGVPQRRRRVFIVGYFGAPCPAEVLFEPEGRSGDIAARGEAGEDIAAPLTASIGGACGPGGGREAIAGYSSGRGDGCDKLVATLNSGGNSGGFRTEPGEHIVVQDVRGGTRDRTDNGQGIGISEGGPCYTLSVTERHGVAYNIIGGGQHSRSHAYATGRTGTIQHKGNSASGNEAGTIVLRPSLDTDGVRDFAGLPDGLDSPRYRALGNAVTVQVAEWIGRRIAAVESHL